MSAPILTMSARPASPDHLKDEKDLYNITQCPVSQDDPEGESEPMSEADLRRVYRKIDFRLLPTMGVLFLLAGIDRGAVSNANIFGFKESLNITTTEYNLVATCFFFTYALFEVPSNIILVRVRPPVWLSSLCLAWGVVMTFSGIVTNLGGAIATRLALGVAEAGMFPGAIYLLSLYYRREMMTYRIAIFFSSATLSLAFAGLLAYGINGMNGVAGLASWRWIFILEGIATCAIAALLFFAIPDNPSRARFLTDREAAYIRKSTMNPNVTRNTLRVDLLRALKDVRNWCLTWMMICGAIPTYGFAYTLPSVLVQMGYRAETAQLLTVPLYVFGCLFTIGVSLLVERKDSRSLGCMIAFGTGFVGMVVTAFLPKTQMPGLRYAFLFPVLGGLYAAAPCILSWAASNSAGPQKRAITSAMTLTLSNLSSAVGTNMFLAREAPNYGVGFGIAIALLGSAFFMALFLRIWLARTNKQREELCANGEGDKYTAGELASLGDLAPTFRYKL